MAGHRAWPLFAFALFSFYSATALLAMQAAVLRDSVSLPVRPFVTFRCFVQTNEGTIVRFSASGRTIILVSGEVVYPDIRRGSPLASALKSGTPLSLAKTHSAITWKRCKIGGKIVLG